MRAAAFLIVCLCAYPGSAGASVTIGQTAPGPLAPEICNAGPFDLLQPSVTNGNSYVIGAAGKITSWSTNGGGGAGVMMTMKVFRPVSGLTYMAVGHDGPRQLSAGLRTFTTSISVKAGDVLGLNSGNASGALPNACLFAVPGENHLEAFGDLADNMSGAFAPPPAGYRVNVSAQLQPDNAFSFRVVRKDKKKGTVTLTVSVPGPGQVALSGKSVKPGQIAAGPTVAAGAGTVDLIVKARSTAKRKLRSTGHVQVGATVTFTPTGGDPATNTKKLKLKKK